MSRYHEIYNPYFIPPSTGGGGMSEVRMIEQWQPPIFDGGSPVLPVNFPVLTQQNTQTNAPVILTTGNEPIRVKNMSDNCSCLVGTPVSINGVCGCDNTGSIRNATPTPTRNDKGEVIYYQQPNAGFDFTQLIKDNPLIALGGVALLVYLFTKK